ncbi:MAG: cell division protein ZipA C-terminal FtsZ-binding domain-containing protein [Nitrosomonas sp.]|nr:cell division protein ZipA C-terminal FtsZ-binding domain-containing protein [Nitrosomonas sp.]
MSDLQLSLIIIGIVVIAVVVLFNYLQQARYRSKVHRAFRHEHGDALFGKGKPNSSTAERIEPGFGDDPSFSPHDESAHQPSVIEQQPPAADHPRDTIEQNDTVNFENAINYMAEIHSLSVIAHERLMDLLQQKFDFGKPVRWFGMGEEGTPWEEITLETAHAGKSYFRLRGCLQLADRSGPVSEINLSRFRDMVDDFAIQIAAEVDCPNIETAYATALQLDAFCANVDVIMGINIISKDGGAFIGTKIRALAEASGFVLESEGIFRYRDSETGIVLFSLGNFESTLFLPSNMRTLTTHGITFLLDVPRVANGEKVFEQMAHIAKLFASTLSGILVDDNRVPLSENGIKKSRKQLYDIQAEMAENNIPAGSPIALKLFD